MSQLTQGNQKRLMYTENKEGDIDGYSARIGWVTFSKTGRSIYYRNLILKRIKGGGIHGNYYCEKTGHEYWVSGVKKRGSNAHWAEPCNIHIDQDAVEEYKALISEITITDG
ncbi:MAG: hypothetical protein GY941_17565 [Planctomycetes bacterium]|nr:hypothetical protein [Planctomycetota bacterium]